jgi:hypothetical protein
MRQADYLPAVQNMIDSLAIKNSHSVIPKNIPKQWWVLLLGGLYILKQGIFSESGMAFELSEADAEVQSIIAM